MNVYSQIGDGTSTDRSSPVQTIAGGSNWAQVSCGAFHTAAIKNDGSLWLWGLNTDGELGTDSTNPAASPVQTVCGGLIWTQVSVGQQMTAAIKGDGTLWAWGYNAFGGLGDNSNTARSSPVQIVGTNWHQVSAGNMFSAAVKTNGTLWTWGNNYFGQLGDGSNAHRSSPVQTIAGGYNWAKVSCGYRHVAAINRNKELWTWGENDQGPLGDDTAAPRSSPVQTVASGNLWKSASAGGRLTGALETTCPNQPVVSSYQGSYTSGGEFYCYYGDLVTIYGSNLSSIASITIVTDDGDIPVGGNIVGWSTGVNSLSFNAYIDSGVPSFDGHIVICFDDCPCIFGAGFHFINQ